MSRGKRYDSEPKLNVAKVAAVIIALIVLIMFIFILNKLFVKDSSTGKIVSKNYFAAYKDDKWGVIDSTGNTVIDPAYKEMIVVPNSKNAVFICTYDVNYDTGEYKTKVLNDKNQEIFTQYDKVEALQNQDKSGNIFYEQKALKIKKNGKYGLISFDGTEVTPVQYDEITVIPTITNSFKVKQNEKYGIIDEDGKTVIEPQYADIDILGDNNKSGFIVKADNGKYGIVDYSNTQILPVNYEGIEKVYGNNMYTVIVNGEQIIVNKNGENVITKGFIKVKQILSSQENAFVYTRSNNKCGIMDMTGKVLVNPQYDSIEETETGIFIASKDGKYGIININNEEKVPFEYSSITFNKKAAIYVAESSNYNAKILDNNLQTRLEGILIELNENKEYIKLRIGDDYKYYNFKFEEKTESDIFPDRTLYLSKKNGKYGYVDKNGKVIVDYIYDDAIEQNDYGFSAVKKDEVWGSIDSQGKVVQEPTYNLDDYLLIDFIGRWHFGSDINMNYYNQM